MVTNMLVGQGAEDEEDLDRSSRAGARSFLVVSAASSNVEIKVSGSPFPVNLWFVRCQWFYH